MAKKIDNILDFIEKDIKIEEDMLEISSYLEESQYSLEDLEDILYRILLRYVENNSYSNNKDFKKRKKRYLN